MAERCTDPRRPSFDPAENTTWTITLPDRSGFDVIAANTYESHSGIARLIELAGVEAYSSQAPATGDHWVILVGYAPEGEEHVEPIMLHDGLYESAASALTPEVLDQAISEVLANAGDPTLWDMKRRHPERFVARIGEVRFAHDHHPYKAKEPSDD